MKSDYKTIGILGGMGPEATAELYKRIIQLYQTQNGAIDDADFPQIIINSVPAEDMLNDLANRRPVIVAQLQRAVQTLERAGANFVAIPCNTATLFLDEMTEAVTIPVLDITALTARKAQELGYAKVGMLASTSTIKAGFYQTRLKEVGITMLGPSNQSQQQVNEVIMRVLAGQKNQADRGLLLTIAKQMKAQGAEAVILGCTELPLLLLADSVAVPLIDTIAVLGEAVFTAANSPFPFIAGAPACRQVGQ